MATFEMVEKLRQHASVSYDEAKQALDASGDDLLEAMIYLEKQGKVHPPQNAGYYSTYREQSTGFDGQAPAPGAPGTHRSGEGFGDMMRRFWNWLCGVIAKGNSNHFEIWRRDERFLSMPVTILVLLAVFCFCVTIPLLIIGLFCGCKYCFQGPEMSGENAVNSAMDSASKAADTIKDEVRHMKEQHEKKD